MVLLRFAKDVMGKHGCFATLYMLRSPAYFWRRWSKIYIYCITQGTDRGLFVKQNDISFAFVICFRKCSIYLYVCINDMGPAGTTRWYTSIQMYTCMYVTYLCNLHHVCVCRFVLDLSCMYVTASSTVASIHRFI